MQDYDQDKEEENIQLMLKDNIHKLDLEEEFQDFIEDKFDSSQIDIQVHSYEFMSKMVEEFLKEKNISMINRNSNSQQIPSSPASQQEPKQPIPQQQYVQQQSQQQQVQQQPQQQQKQNQQQQQPQQQWQQQSQQQQQIQSQGQVSPIGDQKEDSFDFDPNEIQMNKMQQNDYNDSLMDEDMFGDMDPKKFNPVPQQKQSIGSPINQVEVQRVQEQPKQQEQVNSKLTDQQSQEQESTQTSQQQQYSQQLQQQQQQQEQQQQQQQFQQQQLQQQQQQQQQQQYIQQQNQYQTEQQAIQAQRQLYPPLPTRQGENTQNNQDPSFPDDTMALPDFPIAGKPFGMNVTQAFANLSVIAKPSEVSKFIGTDDPVKLIDEFIIQQKQKEAFESGGGDIVNCKKVELNKIGKYLEQNPDKKPTISIQSYRVKEEEGLFKQKYALYTVTLNELKWTSYRRYSDFALLRDIFENQFPGYFIPPLPKKTISRKLEPEYLQKRMKILEQFMEAVLESELLKNSQQLEDFLFIQDESRYRKVATNIRESPTELNSFYSIDGKINCQNSSNFTNYGQAFRSYTVSLTELYGKAKTLTKEVIVNLDGTQKSLKALSTVFQDLSKLTNEFNKQNQIGVNEYLQRLYEENSKFLKEYGDVLEKQHQLFKDHIYMKMRYEKKVCSVFEDMSARRQKLQQTYQDAISKLNTKKRKLFDKKDIKTWDLDPSVQVDQSELMLDDKKAFKYMLPKETNIIKMMSKKINFFSMNLFYETRKYLKIRETKISKDFIDFTKSNGELLTNLKLYHDNHLGRLKVIESESQNNLYAQFEQDKKNIESSSNNTFFTDTFTPKKI